MPSEAELAILLRLHDELSGKMAKPTKAVEGFGTTVAKVGKLTAGFLAASSIEQGVKSLFRSVGSLVDKSREQGQVQAQTNAVLKSTGGVAGVTGEQVADLASKYQGLTRFQDEEVQSAENMLLTFTRIGRDIFPEVTETALDMSTALGQDTKNSAIQLGKALQDPINGVTALRRVGVAFTEEQQKQIKVLVESGRGMEAQRLILAELKKEFGGSATAMTPFEKKLDSIKDFSEDAQESLGFMVQGGLLLVSDWIDDHGDDISDFVSQFDDELSFLQENVEEHIGGVIGIWESLFSIVGDGVDLVDDIIHGQWQDAWKDFKKIGVDTGKLLVNELAALFGAIPNLLIDGLNEAINAANSIKLPEKLTVGIGPLSQSIPIPGGGGGLGIPNVPKIPTQPITIKAIADEAERLEKRGRAGTEAIRGLNTELDDFGETTAKADDSLKKFLESMGQAVQDFLQFSGVNSAVSALFGKTSQEQANLRLAKLTEEDRRARFGEKSVHFGPGEGPGVNDPAKKQAQLDLIDKNNELQQARIEAAKFHITEGQRAEASAELLRVTQAQTILIRDRLNPSIYDLVPEIRGAQTQFITMKDLIDSGGSAVGTALLSLAQRINDYKLPTLTGKNGASTPGDQAFLGMGGFLGAGAQ